MSKHSQLKVMRIVNELRYDFRHFELDTFLTFVAQQRQRPILCQSMIFDKTLSGVWCRGETTDYILHRADLHPVHRTHTILHEIAHMLLNHRPQVLTHPLEVVLSECFEGTEPPPALMRSLHEPYHDELQEQEAEDFATLLQTRILAAQQHHAYLQTPPTVDRLRDYLDGLAFQEPE